MLSPKDIIIIILITLIIILIIYQRKYLYVKSLFTIYDIHTLGGQRWKFDKSYGSFMKNNFYTPIPLKYYAEFNSYIYPRIVTGNNDINKDKIKNICNKMLNYIKQNNIPKSKSKKILIIDVTKDNSNKIKYYIKQNIPFIIRGLDLKIFKDYNFKNLFKELKDEEVLFSPSPPECMKRQYDKFKTLKKNKCYLSNITSIFQKHPNIFNQDDIHKLEFLSGGKMNSKQMFVGIKKGSGTGLHCAFTNNFFINVVGKKTWTFFNPNNTPLLYPYFSKYGIYNASESRFMSYQQTDLSKFPLLEYADHYVYTIQPGEILYNPASWWHSVQNDTKETFALSTRWTFSFNHLLDSHMLRCGNLSNTNLRNLVYYLYEKYGIMGINIIDEHNIMGDEVNQVNNKNSKIPLWDKMTNDNHMLCLNKNCHLKWH